MNSRIARFLVLGIVLAVQLLLAADIGGTWQFEITWGNGEKGKPVIVILQNGEALSGTYTGGLGELMITGTIRGDAVQINLPTANGEGHLRGKLAPEGRAMSGDIELPLAGGPVATGTFTAVPK